MRSPEVWERFDSIDSPEDDYYCLSLQYGKNEELSAEFWLAEEKQCLEHKFKGGGNGDDFYDKLYETMIVFTDVIGKDGVIVGSAGEYGGDDICVMSYFGEEGVSELGDKYVDACEGEDSVIKWVNWFSYKGKNFSDVEKEQLKRCGISYNGETFEEFRC